jgi:hypothetical protein
MVPVARREWTWTKHRILAVVVALAAVAALVAGRSLWSVVVASVMALAIFSGGWAVIGSFARPVPAPPPPGELRRVRLLFRCSICGTEVRMTSANDEVPEPPRHCQEDMDLVAPPIE